jgi:predicted cupin superfamily sugar epimerase
MASSRLPAGHLRRDNGVMPPPEHPRVADLIRELHLTAHPEGGHYAVVFRSPSLVAPADGRGLRPGLTTIYFLLAEGAFSRWHRVVSDEVWHFYEGAPLELLQLSADLATLTRRTLGPLRADQVPVYTVVAGDWQAARTTGTYTLVGCTVGPGFDFQDFTMLGDLPGPSAHVRARWPELAGLV